MRDLLAFYLQRPGVLLRTLTRFVRAGLTSEQVESCGVVETLADSASLATLLKVTAQFSVDELGAFSVDERGKLTRDQGDYAHRSDEERKLEEYAQAYAMVLLPALRRVFSRLAAADERLRALSGKHVFVDAGGFSLEGSLVIPNESGQKTAWPPAGMAYALPEADRLRFFTYWDDRAKRVDVDMHAVAVRDYTIRDSFAENVFSGKEMLQVGWNSNFNVSGITTSGDVTTSVHAVEYIDIHVPETVAAGIRTISISNVIYAGADSWDDIDTAFCGCSVVGSDERDVRLFDRKNVVFRYDLTGKGRHEVTSVIDLKRGFARVHRGEGLGLAHATFTLALYVDILLEACGAQRVESRDDAEAVLYVAPSEDGTWSLMGERFFVGAHE